MIYTAAAANSVLVEGWVTRLTANLLKAYKLNNNHKSDEWFQLFPTDLQEILPIHWDTDTKYFNDKRCMVGSMSQTYQSAPITLTKYAAIAVQKERYYVYSNTGHNHIT